MFVIFSFLAFMWHFLTGRTFIWFNDGYDQHYKALLFYGDFLRQIIKSIFTGNFQNITSWSFLIGEGGDVLQILNYYAIGDPLCLISVFFNNSNMYICYCFIAFIRLYFSGISFLYLINYKNIGNNTSRIAGALTYTFSIWAFYQTSRHIMFLIPLIYLPLIVTGIEKLLDKKKSILLTISVFLCAISNFYYFYNIVLLMVFYCAVRFIVIFGKDYKSYLIAFKDLFIHAFVGLLMSGIVFIPVCYTFLNDARTTSRPSIRWFYPLSYYLELPSGILTTTSVSLGVSTPVIVALILLFTCKTSHNPKAISTLRALNILSLIFLLVPAIGQLFNGLSYVSNKWSFAVPLILGVTIVYLWDDLHTPLKKKDLYIMFSVLIVLTLAITVQSNRRTEYFVALITIAAYTFVSYYLFPKMTPKCKSAITIGFIALSLIYNSFWINSSGGANFAAEARRPSEIHENDNNNEAIAIKNLNDDAFYRISGQDVYRNGSLASKVPSIMHFWTNSNPNVVDFNSDMEILDYKLNEYENFDDRVILNEISSVKYYSVPEDYTSIPYGYEPISTQDYAYHTIYQNPYPMGLTFSTDTLISQSEIESLPVIARQELLIKGAIVDDVNNLNTTHVFNTSATTLPYNMTLSDSVTLVTSKNSFEVTGDNSVVHYTFSGLGNSETYITFEGLTFNGGDETYIVISSGDGVIKLLSFYEDGYQYYNGRRDFTVNLGYREEALNDIWIAFVMAGEYTCDNIEISCQPMNTYESDIEKLQEQVLQNADIHGGHIVGNVDFTNQRMLVYTIPFSEGWTATVDGNTVSTYKVDKKYIGILIDAGEHKVELSYHTPFMNIGILSTVIGMLGVFLLTKKKKIQ